MKNTVDDLMAPKVMTTTPQRTVGHVRRVMSERRVHCMPVVDPAGAPLGIVTSSDLLDATCDETPVSHLMTTRVRTVARSSAVSEAARIMRNHRIHHLLVTDANRVVGVITSFDLLHHIEGRRFVPKVPPARKKGRPGRGRRTAELN